MKCLSTVRSRTLGAFAMSLVTILSTGATAAEVSVRDLIRRHQLKPNEPGNITPASLGLPNDVDTVVALEYTVLVGRDGQEKAVDAKDHKFKVGDQIRVEIKPLQDLYIYIFHQGASGDQLCLLPEEGSGEKAPLIKRGEQARLPADGSVFEFVEPPGSEELIVVATEKPIDDLGALSKVAFDPDKITPETEAVRKDIVSLQKKVIESRRKRINDQVAVRGILTRDAVSKASSRAIAGGKSQVILEEPPHDEEQSTIIALASRGNSENEILFTIPLQSVSGR